MASLKPSSATEGFFQEPPQIRNQLEEDTTLRRLLSLYIPPPHHAPVIKDLHSLASEVLTPHLLALASEAERHPPTLASRTTFGAPRAELRTSAGWRALGRFAVERAMVRTSHGDEARRLGAAARVAAAARWLLWGASSATASCPVAMADGAATLLARHVGEGAPAAGDGGAGAGEEEERTHRAVLGAALARLTSADPARAWTSGQWMTERAGGSDVRGTETVATRVGTAAAGGEDADGAPLGPWRVDGFKWFSSATDAQMAVLLARTERGISAFYAPLRRRVASSSSSSDAGARPETESNGVAIQRLKPKLGTHALPTAELELRGMRAWLIGDEGAGTREIAPVLNITRLHTAIGALGYWARGLAISRAFARVRRIGLGEAAGAGAERGRLLVDVPAHARTVAGNATAYAAMLHLGFLTAALTGLAERPPPSFEDAPPAAAGSRAEAAALSRLLTPVAKAVCAKRTVAGLQECMESLGGVGYVEDEIAVNVARLYRDANVLCIWEGTTDVLAADVVRVVQGRRGEEVRRALSGWVGRKVGAWGSTWEAEAEAVRGESERLEGMFAGMGTEDLTYVGREILQSLAWLASSVMMVEDARRDADVVAVELARRWIGQRSGAARQPWRSQAAMDRLIAFPEASKKDSKL